MLFQVLRRRFDELSRRWGSIAACLLIGLAFLIAFFAAYAPAIFSLAQSQEESDPDQAQMNIILTAICVFIALVGVVVFFVMLYHMARVADAFEDAVRDLDTPSIRQRSVQLFGPGYPYCAQLRCLEDMGLVISGHTVTSSGVLAILFGVIVTFLLSIASSAFSS